MNRHRDIKPDNILLDYFNTTDLKNNNVKKSASIENFNENYLQ